MDLRRHLGGILLLILGAREIACASVARDVFEKIDVPESSMVVNGETVKGKILSGLLVYQHADLTYSLLIDEMNVNPRELFHLIHAENEEDLPDSELAKGGLTLPETKVIKREISADFFCLQTVYRVAESSPMQRHPSKHYQCHIHAESTVESVAMTIKLPPKIAAKSADSESASVSVSGSSKGDE